MKGKETEGGEILARRSWEEGVSAFQAAVDYGINLFDNADIYGGGEAETRFGEIWKSSGIARESLLISKQMRYPPRKARDIL